MTRGIALVALTGMLILSSCAKKETEPPKSSTETETSAAAQPAVAQPVGGPHVFVHLKDGSKVPGAIVASSQTDMVVAGDDGIERKIPMAQVKSVEYAEAQPAPKTSSEPAPSNKFVEKKPAPRPQETALLSEQPRAPISPPPPPPPTVTARTYQLPVGTEISVRTTEKIDSGTAAEEQTFDAEVTRNITDADGIVVIPRRSMARLVIKSASKGGRFRGASDLVLDLKSVAIDGKQYTIDVSDISQKGDSGVGANKRTATYTGGGAALGAIIGAIAGGGKGAAIGAGAGAGAGVLTQVITKGGAIKIPVESVLTFRLDKPLAVVATQ
jgi:hypothetical protein